MANEKKRKTPTSQRRVIINAKGRALGRVASEAARVLQGKHRPDYARNSDQGSWVHIINLSQSKFSGRKFDQKMYHRYTGYPGGITTRRLNTLWLDRPEVVLRQTVYHMLPTNTLRKIWIKRLSSEK